MLRIAIQSKGRLYDDTMNLLAEADIKVSATKRTLLVASNNFPLEVLYLRDDDIPQSVASGVADIGVVGENEYVERGAEAEIISRLGFSKCRLSLAIPKEVSYQGLEWFQGKKIATSYPGILNQFLTEKGIQAEVHVITGSVEISPGIGLADAIFDIVSSGSTLVSNNLREVEVVMQSEALLIGYPGLTTEKRQILDRLLSDYNDGRKKNLFCLAVNLLSLNDLRTVFEKEEREIPLKERASLMDERLKERTETELKLRKKK